MAFTDEQLRFVVRVTRTGRLGDSSVGTGILVSPNAVVTCAHNVLSRNVWDHHKEHRTLADTDVDDDDMISIEIPGVSKPVGLDLEQTPQFHTEGQDLVLLTLNRDVEITPATFVTGFNEQTARRLEKHRLDIYGYRDGGEKMTSVEAQGSSISKEFSESGKNGLHSFGLLDRAVEGYSGGPVIITDADEPLCIGMATLGGEARMTMVALGSDLIASFAQDLLKDVSTKFVVDCVPSSSIVVDLTVGASYSNACDSVASETSSRQKQFTSTGIAGLTRLVAILFAAILAFIFINAYDPSSDSSDTLPTTVNSANDATLQAQSALQRGYTFLNAGDTCRAMRLFGESLEILSGDDRTLRSELGYSVRTIISGWWNAIPDVTIPFKTAPTSFLTSSESGGVVLVDTATETWRVNLSSGQRQLIRQFGRFAESEICLSSDNSHVAFPHDNQIVILNILTGDRRNLRKDHLEDLHAVSGSGTSIVTVCDGDFSIHDTVSEECRRISIDGLRVEDVRFCLDEAYLAAACSDYSVRFIKAADLSELEYFASHDELPELTWLYSPSNFATECDGETYLWNRRSLDSELTRQQLGTSEIVFAMQAPIFVQWEAHGRELSIVDHSIEELRTKSILTASDIHSVIVSDDGRTVAMTLGDASFEVFDSETQNTLMQQKSNPTSSLGFSRNGSMLFELCPTNVKRWRIARPKLLMKSDGISRIHPISAKGIVLLTGGSWTSEIDMATMEMSDEVLPGLNAFAISEDGLRLASCKDGVISISKFGTTVDEAGINVERLYDCCFTKDSRLLIVNDFGRVYAVDSSTLETAYPMHLTDESLVKRVYCASEFVVTCHFDGCIRVWRPSDGELLKCILPTRVSPIFAGAFSADDQLFASAEVDKVRLWDATTWEYIDEIHTNEPVNAVCFSADSRLLATGGLLGNVAIHDIREKERVCPRIVLTGRIEEIECWEGQFTFPWLVHLLAMSPLFGTRGSRIHGPRAA